MKITIVGLGYVGQTLALTLADAGYKVYGSDVDENTLECIKGSRSHIKEPGINVGIKKHLGHNLFVGKPSEIYRNETDVFIICVASPIDKETKKPNIEIVKTAVNEIKKYLKAGQLVVLRSTVPVGTSRDVVKPILEESGLKAGEDFYLVFAPERTIEGAALEELKTLPQIIGGMNDRSVDMATKLFRRISPTIICVSSLEAAELIKLLDNSYRDVRFAYANEIAKYCEKAGLNAFEVITVANREYERNDIPTPSPGVGGACLTKDPYILLNCAESVGKKLELVKLARKINEVIPENIVNKLKIDEPLTNKKVFVVGFAFKGRPETSDIRESPTIDLVKYLKMENANIFGFDPVVEDWKIKSLGVEYVSNVEDGLDNADIVIFMTNHKSFSELNVRELFSKMKKNAVLYDGWGLFKKNEIERLGLRYRGVGIG